MDGGFVLDFKFGRIILYYDVIIDMKEKWFFFCDICISKLCRMGMKIFIFKVNLVKIFEFDIVGDLFFWLRLL